MLLLLLYGLAPDCAFRIDCRPRKLPRFSVVSLSGCARRLRLRNIPPPPGLSDDIDERVTLVVSGCRICCDLIAPYISYHRSQLHAHDCKRTVLTFSKISISDSHARPCVIGWRAEVEWSAVCTDCVLPLGSPAPSWLDAVDGGESGIDMPTSWGTLFQLAVLLLLVVRVTVRISVSSDAGARMLLPQSS